MSGGGDEDWGSAEETKLSPAAQLFQSSKFNCYIVTIIGCKTTMDSQVIKAGLAQTLLKHPRLSSKLVVNDSIFGRRRRWVPTPVKLEEHVFVPTFDSKPENPNQFLQDYVSHLTTNPLDISKPLWELHLLNLPTSDAESVGIFRIHHSVGDGASLMSLLLACTRQTSDPEKLPTLPAPLKRSAETEDSEGHCGGRFLWILTAIWSAITLIWNTLVDIMVFVSTILFLKDTKTPIKGLKGVEKNTKRFVHRTISLDHIKLIKNTTNTTINDVLLGITQAGLSKYLNRRYGLIAKDEGTKEKKNYLPKHIRLSATVLVNLRPTLGIEALADMMAKNSKTKWGNWIGYLLLPFNIALQDDPLDYVRQAKAVIDRKKHSFEAICTYFCAQLLLKILGAELTAATALRAISSTTLAFSNLMGPLEEVSFYGHRIAYLAPSVYGHPHALTIHFQSYVDNMTIALAVDPNVIPDPQQLLDDVEQSLQLIRGTILEQRMNKEIV
ncbi:wax ester synthase/diacylglycerol acyltransferase 5 isoform X1 [Cannabis sativa]|uniref:wax ester synthase/diacylglycerol acyltransferase 5 isoform X1 n=1 Tax=Cannabis sativa TaxID=3483 RepID=UPI0029CA1858|nr:wax ester synthase/diacylglycerol acyltransferase 5 isoform X1 [Cannabis sativa]